MPGRRHLRLTLASLMGLVALAALLIAFLAPLGRWGRPPCLTTGQTIRWLATGRGAARCDACHAGMKQPPLVQGLAQLMPGPKPPCEGAARGTSCAACHGGRGGG